MLDCEYGIWLAVNLNFVATGPAMRVENRQILFKCAQLTFYYNNNIDRMICLSEATNQKPNVAEILISSEKQFMTLAPNPQESLNNFFFSSPCFAFSG